MSKKSPRIAEWLKELPPSPHSPHYLGFFVCFNQQLFFEAHDVLEELWLAGGKSAPNHRFHKGLIQLAGAFVHLQKNRLQPAVALFNLAEGNLSVYPETHDGIQLTKVLALIHTWRTKVEVGHFQVNPLDISSPPALDLPSGPA